MNETVLEVKLELRSHLLKSLGIESLRMLTESEKQPKPSSLPEFCGKDIIMAYDSFLFCEKLKRETL